MKTRIKKSQIKKAFEEGSPRVVFDGHEPTWSGRKKGFTSSFNLSIVETRPSFRTVKIHYDWGKRTYRLAMPYMQFYSLVGCPRVTWSQEPLDNCHHKVLSIPLLPNIDWRGSTCLGNIYVEKGQDVCRAFWTTIFTPEEGSWYYKTELERTTLKSFDHWHDLSSKASDPMEVFEGFTEPTFDYRQIAGLERLER